MRAVVVDAIGCACRTGDGEPERTVLLWPATAPTARSEGLSQYSVSRLGVWIAPPSVGSTMSPDRSRAPSQRASRVGERPIRVAKPSPRLGETDGEAEKDRPGSAAAPVGLRCGLGKK
jgi:hypothetical protein